MTILLRTKRQSGPVGSDNKPVYELEKEGIYLLVVHVAAVRKTHPVNNDNATTITTTTTKTTTQQRGRSVHIRDSPDNETVD